MPLILSGSGGFSNANMPAGSVIQVTSGTFATNLDTTSTSVYGVDTGLTANITPYYANSKILVTVYTGVCDRPSAAAESMSFSVLRNGVEIQRATNFLFNSGSWPQELRASATIVVVDTPNTTSTLTYKLTVRSRLGGSVSFNTNADIATITLQEIKQ
jgi:hypothetical protein